MISIDPIAIVVGVIGILVAVGVAYWQRGQKKLWYSVIAVVPLIELDQNLMNRIHISYENKPIMAIWQAFVQIKNSGTVAIEPGDYHSPIRIDFTKPWTAQDFLVLNVEIIRSQPKDLDIHWTTDEEGVTMQPVLLNAGDSFIVQVLLNGKVEKITVTGRISGIKEITGEPWDTTMERTLRDFHYSSNALIALSAWTGITALLYILLAFVHQSGLFGYWAILWSVAAWSIMIMLALRLVIRSVRKRLRKREILR